MGLGATHRHPAHDHVYRLISHASELRQQSAGALETGDVEKALILLEQAELLSCDVSSFIDDLELDDASELLGKLKRETQAAELESQDRGSVPGRPSKLMQRIRYSLGASLALGGALV